MHTPDPKVDFPSVESLKDLCKARLAIRSRARETKAGSRLPPSVDRILLFKCNDSTIDLH